MFTDRSVLNMNKGVNTKEKIIEKSAELFSKYGYRGCSLSDIMNETNLKKGGIYNHFRNKDEIALEAFDYSFKKMLKRFRKHLDYDVTSTQKIQSVIKVFASFVDDPVVKGGCPVFNTAMDAQHTHPKLLKKARDSMNVLSDYIKIKIEEGKASGEFQKDADTNEITSILIMNLEGAIVMSRLYGTNAYMKTAITYINQYLTENLYKF